MNVSHPLLGQNRWILGPRETWSQKKKKGGEGRLTEEDTQCQPLAPKVHVPMSVSAHTHKGNAKYNNSYTKLFYTDISF